MGWGGIRKNLMSRIRDFFSVDSFWDDHFEKHGRFLGIILIIGSCLAFPANRRWAYTFWTLDNCFGIETSVEDYEHWKATLKL